MIIIAQVVLCILVSIGIGFFGAMLVAAVLEWRRTSRDSKNLMWNELQRTNYERRRPAAK